MSEEAIQDTGSQEVAADAAAPVHFLDGVDEQYRTNPTLQNFNDVNGLAKSYVHLRSKMGADTIVKPQQSWTDDQYNEFYTELGRPQSFEEYDIQGATGDGLDQYKQAAHAAGLSNRQAQAMANYLQTLTEDMSVQSEQVLESTNNETRAALEREYGQALKQKMQMADAVSSRYLSPEVFDSIELADGRSLGDHPDIIRMFVNIAQDIGEDLEILIAVVDQHPT